MAIQNGLSVEGGPLKSSCSLRRPRWNWQTQGIRAETEILGTTLLHSLCPCLIGRGRKARVDYLSLDICIWYFDENIYGPVMPKQLEITFPVMKQTISHR